MLFIAHIPLAHCMGPGPARGLGKELSDGMQAGVRPVIGLALIRSVICADASYVTSGNYPK